jgi:hypothetical protein
MRCLLSVMILTLSECAVPPVGRHHTSDAELERRFRDHRAEFEALRGEFEANPEMTRLFAGAARIFTSTTCPR